ncbi:MAG: serine hydrolase domain-containing protein [Vulcanimicrobiaceae bacterium]
MLRSVVACACVVALSCGAWAAPRATRAAAASRGACPSAQKIARVERFARDVLERSRTPGLSLGVSVDGRVCFARGFGVADVTSETPVTPHTTFSVGSITKQFTAVAVLHLVQRGSVALDAPVSRYVPSAPHGFEITIRELLDQTSGLPEYVNSPVMVNASGQPYDVPPKAILAYVAALPLDFDPGARFEYSNTNYVLLSEVIAAVTHRSYRSYLAESVFTPAGLHETAYGAGAPASAARGYDASPSIPFAIAYVGFDWLSGAGALSSSVLDVLAFDRALLGGRLISARLVRAMLRPRPDAAIDEPAYGFAWFVDRDAGLLRNHHTGSIAGFASGNSCYPQLRLCAVVLTNSSNVNPARFLSRVLERVR